jgi:putative ABC transport system permease protein
MAIPLAYNLRNLAVRKGTTLMTALGITLTVSVLLSVLALVGGLRTAFQATGHPLQILVMRKGSTAELTSVVSRTAFQDLKYKPGIARLPDGEPMASLEMITIVNIPSRDSPDGMNVNLRGLMPIGWKLREDLRLAAGRYMETGRRELVVGRSISEACPEAHIGGRLRFGRGEWTVVGIVDGGRSTLNSEVFADLNQASSDWNRSDFLSSVLVRAVDPVSLEALRNSLQADRVSNLVAVRERQYYDDQAVSALPVQFMGAIVAIIMAIGSSFAAMNTMYAAVSRRSPEIAVLRVLGFSRAGILCSFLLESLLISLLGGVLGCLLVLPLNNLSTNIGSFVTYAQIAFQFHISPAAMLTGVLFALVMGTAGGLAPARSASRKEILTAFREL